MVCAISCVTCEFSTTINLRTRAASPRLRGAPRCGIAWIHAVRLAISRTKCGALKQSRVGTQLAFTAPLVAVKMYKLVFAPLGT